MSRRAAALAAVAGLVGTGAFIGTVLLRNPERPSTETLAAGHAIYREHCASCHGQNLEGQPGWQTPLPSGRLPAPPHDASGHTWHHPDRVLFAITKHGTAAVVGRDYESDMPGFQSILSDNEIRAVFAFIKDTLPERERRYQRDITRREPTGLQFGKPIRGTAGKLTARQSNRRSAAASGLG